ncbi:uncharacterized protein LOC101861918 [Aplysia californica]|uniref:Uncharacterized protein LOC101861918 n=1 Tax=Aplysia californica TaxID=6500 RepID=A0ABM0K8E9_APLCA|nr:uncharacterized protein LOC101861918 [Aplysia californica]
MFYFFSPDKPKIWCGGEHARALEFPNGVNLTYFPGTKGQGSGFKMQLIPDYSFPVCISDQRPLEARDTPTFLYSLQGGYGYERDDCRWNVTAPDDKVVLVRSFATKIFPRYGSWFPFLGRFFEPVDFLDLNTDESSVELDESYFELVGSSTRGSLLAEYVAASKRDVDCVNSTTVEVDLDAEETLIQLHSSTSRQVFTYTVETVYNGPLPIVVEKSGRLGQVVVLKLGTPPPKE